jgi:hypothetical protein
MQAVTVVQNHTKKKPETLMAELGFGKLQLRDQLSVKLSG